MGDVIGGLFGGAPDVPPPPPPPVVQVAPPKISSTTTKLVGKPLSVIYGRAKVEGNVVWRRVAADSSYVEQIVALCWGPVTIYTDTIRVNEKRPFTINDAQNANAATDPGYYEEVSVWTRDGNLAQAPLFDQPLGYNRVAYIWVRARASDNVSNIDTVTCEVERQYLFDGQYNTDAGDIVPLQRGSNPVAAALDYLLNTEYGAGRSINDYGNFASWLSAMAYCDQQVSTGSLDGAISYTPRWSADIEIGTDVSETHEDIVEKLLEHANAKVYSYGGLTKCWIARATPPVPWTLDRSNFTPSAVTSTDIMDVPNLIDLTYYEPGVDQADQRPVTWIDDTRIDTMPEVRKEFTYEGIRDRATASRMASFLGRKAIAERMHLTGTADHRFAIVEPGDQVTVTIGDANVNWFQKKLFWVDSITPENDDGDVQLELTEFGGNTLFDDSLASELDNSNPIFARDPTAIIFDPNGRPAPPIDVTGVIGEIEKKPTKLFFIDLAWQPANEPDFMHKEWVIYRRTTSTAPWGIVTILPGTSSAYRDESNSLDVINNDYLYMIVARTSQGLEGVLPVGNNFTIKVPALSKDAPLPVTNVRTTLRQDSRIEVSWEYKTPPVDFEGFVIRFCAGPRFEESFAQTLHEGVLTSNKLTTFAMSVSGFYVICVQARDTFGNLSQPALYNFVMPAPRNPDRLNVVLVTTGRNVSYRLERIYLTSQPVNLAGLELRVNLVGQVDWTNSSPLLNGVAVDPVSSVPALPAGQLAVMAKAVDTAGNRSSLPITVFVDSPGPTVQNIFDTTDFSTFGGSWIHQDENLVLQSEAFEDAAWVKTGSITITSGEPDPFSGTAGRLITRSAIDPAYEAQAVTKTAAATRYVKAIFAKAQSAKYLALRLQGDGPARADAVFDLSAGTVVPYWDNTIPQNLWNNTTGAGGVSGSIGQTTKINSSGGGFVMGLQGLVDVVDTGISGAHPAGITQFVDPGAQIDVNYDGAFSDADGNYVQWTVNATDTGGAGIWALIQDAGPGPDFLGLFTAADLDDFVEGCAWKFTAMSGVNTVNIGIDEVSADGTTGVAFNDGPGVAAVLNTLQTIDDQFATFHGGSATRYGRPYISVNGNSGAAMSFTFRLYKRWISRGAFKAPYIDTIGVYSDPKGRTSNGNAYPGFTGVGAKIVQVSAPGWYLCLLTAMSDAATTITSGHSISTRGVFLDSIDRTGEPLGAFVLGTDDLGTVPSTALIFGEQLKRGGLDPLPIYQATTTATVAGNTSKGAVQNGFIDAISGALAASETDAPFMFLDDVRPMYAADSSAVYGGTFAKMVYEVDWFPIATGTALLESDIVGDGVLVEFKMGGIVPMFTDDTAALYAADTGFYYTQDAATVYENWGGYKSVNENENYGFRVTTGGGQTRGEVRTLKAKIDIPDVEYEIQALAVTVGGTRAVPPAGKFRFIDVVLPSINFVSGQTAAFVRWIDKDPALGPLLKCYDSANVEVAGTVDVYMRGA